MKAMELSLTHPALDKKINGDIFVVSAPINDGVIFILFDVFIPILCYDLETSLCKFQLMLNEKQTKKQRKLAAVGFTNNTCY